MHTMNVAAHMHVFGRVAQEQQHNDGNIVCPDNNNLQRPISQELRALTKMYSFHDTHTCTPRRTNTSITGGGVVKLTDQYAEEKRWVFSFDLRLKTNA